MMNLSYWTLFSLVPPLLLIEAFFSGSEIALLSVDKLALQKRAKQGDHGAALALSLANHPERVLSTTLVMTSASVITITALIALFMIERVAHGNFLAVAITSPLVVIFGELLQKQFFSAILSRSALGSPTRYLGLTGFSIRSLACCRSIRRALRAP